MANYTDPRQQQDQRMGNQSANQGARTGERREFGVIDDAPMNVNTGTKPEARPTPNDPKGGLTHPGNLSEKNTPMQPRSGVNQQGTIGGYNTTDPLKPSAGTPQQGTMQQRGNSDVQRDRNVGQRGNNDQGEGRQNESVERTGPDAIRR